MGKISEFNFLVQLSRFLRNSHRMKRVTSSTPGSTASTNNPQAPVVATAKANSPPPPMTKKFDDVGSMALLFVLYTLQGIPMGLSGSVPLLLAKRVTYWVMFLGTPSFLPKNNLDHGAERRQSRPFASFVQAFLVVG